MPCNPKLSNAVPLVEVRNCHQDLCDYHRGYSQIVGYHYALPLNKNTSTFFCKVSPLENLLPRCSYAIEVDPNTADRPLKRYFLLNKGTTYLNNNASDKGFFK